MIAVFGASVTKQKTGFAVELKNQLDQEVQIFGYGSMHIKDGGICYLNKVVASKPQLCFIDWFTTGYTETNTATTEYIDTLIFRLTEIQCKIVFLFFPHQEHAARMPFYKFCKEHLDKRQVAYFDLNEHLTYSTELLRDLVHTTDFGSKQYADLLIQYYNQKVDSIGLPAPIDKNPYCDIQQMSINGVFTKEFKMTGNAQIIGFMLTIGKHSGIVTLENDNSPQRWNTWDQWCYYNRFQFNIDPKLTGDATLHITAQAFDTSSCKLRAYDFQKHKKKLVVHTIYYIGSLEIKNSSWVGLKSRLEFLPWALMHKQEQWITQTKSAVKRMIKLTRLQS